MRLSELILAFFAAAALLCADSPGKNQPQSVRFDADAVNRPDQPPVNFGDQGPAVARAQILLDRAHFSCGEIDGRFGTNLQKTVSAFQRDRGLPVSGAVDDATWQALNRDQAPALTAYIISPEDLKGPFLKEVPKGMEAKAKLPSMAYTSPEQELAERFHAHRRLLEALNPGADFTQPGRQLTVPLQPESLLGRQGGRQQGHHQTGSE
jgi:hypothetical protein